MLETSPDEDLARPPSGRAGGSAPSARTGVTGREVAGWVLAWGVSRAIALLAASVAADRHARSLTEVLTSWDGVWYLRLVAHGYPSAVPASGGRAVQSTIAFFPGYPLLVRAVDLVAPGGAAGTAVAVNALLGLGATAAFALLVRRRWGTAAASRAAWVFSSFPGALVLSMAYSEGLMLAGAIGCLLLLGRRRWVLAGLAGAVATITRPNGIEVTAACAWVAASAVRRRREWRALAAPALSAAGILGYFGFLWGRTGDAAAWFRVEHEAWGQSNDAGQAFLRQIVDVATRRATSLDDVVLAAMGVLTLGLLVWLVRLRPRPELVVTAVVGTLLLVTGILGARPRLVLGTFPLLVGPSVSLRRGWSVAWVAASLLAGSLLLVHLDANFAGGRAVLLSP